MGFYILKQIRSLQSIKLVRQQPKKWLSTISTCSQPPACNKTLQFGPQHQPFLLSKQRTLHTGTELQEKDDQKPKLEDLDKAYNVCFYFNLLEKKIQIKLTIF